MNPKPQKGPEDRIIHEYSKRLQTIYDDRTAGDYTFVGVLGEFLNTVDNARKSERVYRMEGLPNGTPTEEASRDEEGNGDEETREEKRGEFPGQRPSTD